MLVRLRPVQVDWEDPISVVETEPSADEVARRRSHRVTYGIVRQCTDEVLVIQPDLDVRHGGPFGLWYVLPWGVVRRDDEGLCVWDVTTRKRLTRQQLRRRAERLNAELG